ncbi:MAG: HD domain-containing protein [bacterium]|nr:HD domain-containing protein [bacterium]
MTTTMIGRHREVVKRFTIELVELTLNREMHDRASSYVADSLHQLISTLGECEAAGVEMPLQLQFGERIVFYDGEPLDSPSLQAARLLKACSDRNVAMLSFRPQLTAEELNRALDLLLHPRNREALQRDNRDRVLKAFGVRNVDFTLNTPADPGNRRSAVDANPELDKAVGQYQDLADVLQTNHARAYRDLDLAIDEAAGVVERTIAELEEPSTLLSLATHDDVDRFTVGHSVRVALLTLQVARQLGLAREQLVSIGTAALMHDIGKSKVPQEILFKCGRLDEHEWHLMSQHPRLGAELLLEQHSEVDPCAIGAAFCHHMGPHGHGYPRPKMPILPSGTSHLVRVSDVFEALTSVRPYKQALSPMEAFAIMFAHESDFEPNWLRAFARTIGLFPTGTRVMLDDGSHGMVLAQGQDPSRPIVRLFAGAEGRDLLPDEPDSILIGTEVEGRPRRVLAINTQDRVVDVPEFEELPVLSTPHACLSEDLARAAANVGRPQDE